MKTNEMTPEQIRVRCAEIEGWTNIAGNEAYVLGYENGASNLEEIPEYTNSRDAIIEAVIRLTPKRRKEWIDEMFKRAPLSKGQRLDKIWYATASALDRARAFVATHEQ